MKDADDIRAIAAELRDAANQLEFERELVGEAISLLERLIVVNHDVSRAEINDFLRRYENRAAIFASRKLAEKSHDAE